MSVMASVDFDVRAERLAQGAHFRDYPLVRHGCGIFDAAKAPRDQLTRQRDPLGKRRLW